jgi:NADH-quinone oxidoreductase subunit M
MEATIIPMYIMMLSWQKSWQKSRDINHIFQYLIYGMASAMLILVALIMMYLETGSSDLIEIYKLGIRSQTIFWLLMIGLGIKMPVWPFCNWLPAVHGRSNTICSVLLASVVLKFGALIIIRFIEPIFSEYLLLYRDAMFAGLIITMVFSAARALSQDDLKQFFAYFSIFHMSLYFMIMLGRSGESGFIFAMMQHSLVISFLFFLADVIERTFNTRSISELRHSAIRPCKLKRFMLFGTLALIGTPLTSGFISEAISIYSASQISNIYEIITAAAVLAMAFIAFDTYNSTFGGWEDNGQQRILGKHEQAVVVLLISCILIFGLCPRLILQMP